MAAPPGLRVALVERDQPDRLTDHPPVRGADGTVTVPVDHGDENVGRIVLHPERGGVGLPPGTGSLVEPLARLASTAIRGSPFDRAAQDLVDEVGAMARQREAVATALGVLMAQNDCGRDTALTLLRRASALERRPLAEVAALVVAAAQLRDEEPRPPAG